MQSGLSHKVYCLKDDKSLTYGPPITFPTRGMFLREIMEQLSEGKAIFSKHPTDFSMYELGEYDAATGQFSLYETKTCLGLVQDLRVSQSN